MATVVLGAVIAAIFGVGVYNIYSNFFKGTSTCCSESDGCGGCGSAGSCSTNLTKMMADSYRVRVEKIEKFNLRRTIDVEGMTCEHCVANVVHALENVDGVAIAAASLEKKSAQAGLTKNISDDVLINAIRDAGYTPGLVAA